ncbi:phage tail sheath family protein [Thermogemmatispora tikiterensis]|uniref:Phage tail protein n=1 Tax=Thermogemmatispora tikiterensis TaxID=1825093 RepID=A0A328VTS2_9CHLR|nr:phage tail sheath C-terminal domain-containing protein [Thermogemmatispora tikiterensis]RAQ97515.1 phage tail protein [Thermogemmatispora tikiterensis]
MPEYLSPGVYIQEVDSGPRPIEGVGTATAAFVGFAPAGPANRPVLITNWSQYVTTFGSLEEGGVRNPHLPGSYLSHAVYGYFLNGGGRCYVTRLVSSGTKKDKPAPLLLPSRASKAVPSLIIHPKNVPEQDIQIEVLPPSKTLPPPPAPASSEGEQKEAEATPPATAGNRGLFTLKVSMGDEEEYFENLSVGSSGAGVKSAVETVNQLSQLIRLVEPKTSGSAVERAPEPGTYVLRAPAQLALPQVQPDHFAGSAAERSGFEGLEVAEDVTMVCCPDLMAAYQAGLISREGVKAVQLAMIAHCEGMGDRLAILDPLPDLAPQQVKIWREAETAYDSKFAALYYPWIKVSGPDGRPLAVPPSGHIAGIYARSDNERGVHKAPANEVVRGALEGVIQVTKGEQDTLNPSGINCIRSFTGRGLRVWGARTLSSDSAWRYVNVRRLFNYIEKSIERGTQWVVFEPNDVDLWARVKRDITAFLTGVWRDGMLFGRSPEEAFFVKCDEEINPPDVRDRGMLFIDIGLAPVKPAEFVVFRLRQWAGGGA